MKRQYKLKRNYTELGAFLQQSRLRAGLTQREVAERLGYSCGQFLSNQEAGISPPPLKKLKRLVKTYRMPQGTVTRLLLAGQERKIMEAFNA